LEKRKKERRNIEEGGTEKLSRSDHSQRPPTSQLFHSDQREGRRKEKERKKEDEAVASRERSDGIRRKVKNTGANSSPSAVLLLTALEEEDSDLTKVEIDEILRLMRHIRTEVATHDAMPRRVVLLVELLQ
jgi:hypothetical protein